MYKKVFTCHISSCGGCIIIVVICINKILVELYIEIHKINIVFVCIGQFQCLLQDYWYYQYYIFHLVLYSLILLKYKLISSIFSVVNYGLNT